MFRRTASILSVSALALGVLAAGTPAVGAPPVASGEFVPDEVSVGSGCQLSATYEYENVPGGATAVVFLTRDGVGVQAVSRKPAKRRGTLTAWFSLSSSSEPHSFHARGYVLKSDVVVPGTLDETPVVADVYCSSP